MMDASEIVECDGCEPEDKRAAVGTVRLIQLYEEKPSVLCDEHMGRLDEPLRH